MLPTHGKLAVTGVVYLNKINNSPWTGRAANKYMSNEKHVIDYTVNDEPQSTIEKDLTPVQIMTNAGIDPAKNYLIQLDGKSQKSFKDNPNAVIHMHEGIKFITNFMGPKPVSNT